MIDTKQKNINSIVEQMVIEIAAKTFGTKANGITAQSSFVDDLAADSLDQVEFMMAIEDAFKCEIPDEEASKITSVNDIVNYIINNADLEKLLSAPPEKIPLD